MKHIVKLLLLVTGIFTLSAVASAQQVATYTTQLEEKSLPVGEFATVNVVDDFEVTLTKGSYGVKVSTDKVLAPYVQVYVRSKTLYISYDEKSVPKDVKKLFKGRNAPKPIFRAIVYLPQLNGLQLSNNASVYATDSFNGSSFRLEMTDKAQLKSLTLECTEASLNLKKNAQATLQVTTQTQTEVNLDNNANLKLSCNASNLALVSNGNADLLMTGDCTNAALKLLGSSDTETSLTVAEQLKLEASGSAALKLSGNMPVPQMELTADKGCKLDATQFSAQNLVANMSGNARIDIAVEENLNATLVGGSALYYSGTPAITIGKIIKSTLAPQGSTTK